MARTNSINDGKFDDRWERIKELLVSLERSANVDGSVKEAISALENDIRSSESEAKGSGLFSGLGRWLKGKENPAERAAAGKMFKSLFHAAAEQLGQQQRRMGKRANEWKNSFDGLHAKAEKALAQLEKGDKSAASELQKTLKELVEQNAKLNAEIQKDKQVVADIESGVSAFESGKYVDTKKEKEAVDAVRNRIQQLEKEVREQGTIAGEFRRRMEPLLVRQLASDESLASRGLNEHRKQSKIWSQLAQAIGPVQQAAREAGAAVTQVRDAHRVVQSAPGKIRELQQQIGEQQAVVGQKHQTLVAANETYRNVRQNLETQKARIEPELEMAQQSERRAARSADHAGEIVRNSQVVYDSAARAHQDAVEALRIARADLENAQSGNSRPGGNGQVQVAEQRLEAARADYVAAQDAAKHARSRLQELEGGGGNRRPGGNNPAEQKNQRPGGHSPQSGANGRPGGHVPSGGNQRPGGNDPHQEELEQARRQLAEAESALRGAGEALENAQRGLAIAKEQAASEQRRREEERRQRMADAESRIWNAQRAIEERARIVATSARELQDAQANYEEARRVHARESSVRTSVQSRFTDLVGELDKNSAWREAIQQDWHRATATLEGLRQSKVDTAVALATATVTVRRAEEIVSPKAQALNAASEKYQTHVARSGLSGDSQKIMLDYQQSFAPAVIADAIAQGASGIEKLAASMVELANKLEGLKNYASQAQQRSDMAEQRVIKDHLQTVLGG